MKTLVEIQKTLNAFNAKYGLCINDSKQGSDDWFTLKLGVISASNAHKAVAKRDSDTRATYMAELVAQVCTGIIEEINTRYTDWGKQHEPAARSYYEFITNQKVTQLPFVFKDETFRIGCSPDGIVSATKGQEIKCPYNSANYIKFLVDDRIKPEYQWQTQFTLWVMNADEWDFNQYDPRIKTMPMKTLTLKRDKDKFAAFDDLIPMFISDMDKILERAGARFGDQWTRMQEQESA